MPSLHRHRERWWWRGLAGLGGVVNDSAHFGVDLADHVFGHAELQQPFAIDLDWVAKLPAIEFAFRPIFCRIGPRMATVPVRHALNQRWAFASAGLVVCRLRCAIDN